LRCRIILFRTIYYSLVLNGKRQKVIRSCVRIAYDPPHIY
jgi:hypothetical protein